MKAHLILEDFLIQFADCEGELNKMILKKWFNSSKHNEHTSRSTMYDFFRIVEHFSIDNDTYSFNIDWKKVRKSFASDKEFIKKIDSVHKKGGN